MCSLSHNLPVLVIAAMAAAFAWVFGGTRGDLFMSYVPWLWAFVIEVMLFFPQQRPGESSSSARSRVWAGIRTDPVFWASLVFMLLLAVPFLNAGLCPICDFPRLLLGEKAAPPYPILPYCVNRMHHLNVVLWFGPALTVLVAARHALLKSGKRDVLQLLVWNGVALAMLGFLQQATGAEGPLWVASDLHQSGIKAPFFSTFGYVNMAGDYFVALFVLSVALWRRTIEDINQDLVESDAPKRGSAHKRFWMRHQILIASAILFFAAMATLSRSAILIGTVSAAILFLHAGVCKMYRLDRAHRVRVGALVALVLVTVALAASVFTPKNFRKEVDTLDATTILDRMTGRTAYHSDVAVSLIKEHPFFGCGGWGYQHLSVAFLPERVTRGFRYIWARGGSNVHNDYLQFAVEHGLVGLALLGFIVLATLLPCFRIWSYFIRSARFAQRKDRPPSPVAIFALPSGAFAVLVAIGGTLLHAFGDCPLRSPAIMTLFFIELAAVDGFLPRLTLAKKDSED